MKSGNVSVVVHGGAWRIPDQLIPESMIGVKNAAALAFDILQKGGSAADAVSVAVSSMEDNPVFDAGVGSCYNEDKDIELDALFVRGDLETGAVACIQNVKNPIQVAKYICENTPHVLIAGAGASKLAQAAGFAQVSKADLASAEAEAQFARYKKYGVAVGSLFNSQEAHDTVGAVCLDASGMICSGTSTGGITGKAAGRVGDTPLNGCGGAADSCIGGVSCTGHGESLVKTTLASRVMADMASGTQASAAIKSALETMLARTAGRGGAVALTAAGDTAHGFSTHYMPWVEMRGHAGSPGPHHVASGYKQPDD